MQAFRLGLVTWNVGGAQTGIIQGADSLLRCASHCDVIVVGLQEVPLGRRGWKTELHKSLGPNWVYVGGERYAGMRVKVFSRVSGLPLPDLRLVTLSAQQTARVRLNARVGRYPIVSVTGSGKRVGAGVADRWPNKGAVAVEVSFGPGCRTLFVVAHLAANEEGIQGREDDWRAILRRLDRIDIPLTRGTDPVIAVPLFHRYEHVFVLGDLNYRIAPPGTDHKERVRWVQHHVRKGDWRSLVDADQLIREMMGNNVFANFQEGDISFPPTFKIDPKTGKYSFSRIPSYCDRILWHSLPARVDLVRWIQYRSLIDFKQSDHIPVFGEYELRVPVLVKPRRSLGALHGLRVVLEFMLVRYVKGTRPFMRRETSSDGPFSMRHIAEPGSLNSRLSSTLSDRAGPMDCFMDDDLDEDVEDEDVDIDEVEGDEDETSSLSSDDADIYGECLNESENGIWNMYTGPDISVYPEIEEPLLIARPRVARHYGYSPDRPSAADLGRRNGYSPSAGVMKTPRISAHRKGHASGAHSDSEAHIVQGSSDYLRTHSDELSTRESPRPIAHVNSGTRKRDSLSRQVDENIQSGDSRKKKSKRRRRINGFRMEVHGQGLFLKQGRVYRVSIPKRENGLRERIGESLPVIPFEPISSIKDLEFRHVLIEFGRKKTRVGTSGALPLRELIPHIGKLYAFELSLTKYGQPVATLEACVQLTVSNSPYWQDSQDRVVRNCLGEPSRYYRGPLEVRERTQARSRPEKRILGGS